MTDAKDVTPIIQKLREFVEDGNDGTFGTVAMHGSSVIGGRVSALLAEIDTLTRERDEAVKRRREIDDEAFDYAEQIETLKPQLAWARELMEEAANDIWYMVNAEYHGPDDVHPAMRAKYTRDMEIVTRLTAALSEATP